jgi:hypothetical protein
MSDELRIQKIINRCFNPDTNTLNTSAVFSPTSNDVEMVDSAGDPLIGQKIMDESIPVVWASNQTDVGVKGLKALGDGDNVLLNAQPTAILVPVGAEIVNLYNTHATSILYPGISASQGAEGIPILPEEFLLNYPVTGLVAIHIYPSVNPSTVGVQFYGRS